MKVPKIIEEELSKVKTFNIVEGTKHQKIFVNGIFCGIVPKNGKSNTRRSELNVRSQIRRAARS